MKSCLRLGIAVAVVLAFAGGAQAATITFTSSAAFFSALPQGSFTETYESYAVNSIIVDGTTLNGITYNTFPAGTDGRIDTTFNSLGAQSLALSRPPTLESFFFTADSMTVSFASPTTAIGIFFNALLSPAGSFRIQTAAGTATSAAAYDIPTFYFVGLISDTAFSSATIGGTGTAASGFNLDNLTIATPVPEPTSVLLLGTGALALIARLRLRRSVS